MGDALHKVPVFAQQVGGTQERQLAGRFQVGDQVGIQLRRIHFGGCRDQPIQFPFQDPRHRVLSLAGDQFQSADQLLQLRTQSGQGCGELGGGPLRSFRRMLEPFQQVFRLLGSRGQALEAEAAGVAFHHMQFAEQTLARALIGASLP